MAVTGEGVGIEDPSMEEAALWLGAVGNTLVRSIQ